MKIDTSTTEGKIEVMQAPKEGKEVQANDLTVEAEGWFDPYVITWNWYKFNYRIKPPTIEEAVRGAADLDTRELQRSNIGWAKFGAEWQKDQDQ